jgi:hypothetical protein
MGGMAIHPIIYFAIGLLYSDKIFLASSGLKIVVVAFLLLARTA